MSQEKLLYESGLPEIVEASPNAPETIAPGTGQTDIAQQAPKSRLARNVISQTLPFMLGFVQPLTSPVSFVFGFKERSQIPGMPGSNFPLTNQQPPSKEPTGNAPGTEPVAGDISHPSTTINSGQDPLSADPMTIADWDGLRNVTPPENPAVPSQEGTPSDEDPIITRRLVETEVREVIFNLTNEAIQDVQTLFKEDFPGLLRKFLEEGGEIYGLPESDTETLMASFFLPQMISKSAQKINTDFINWADTTASNLGTVTIDTLDKMPLIFNAIGEMREKLSNNTNKSGSIFIIATPRVANYIAGTLGMTSSNGSDALEIGKPNQNPHLNGFIGQFGDVKLYQYRGSRTATGDSMIMGFDGENGPNTASVYYHPFKEYIIQGGDDYMTGHSSVFYRVRDTWTVNPLDVFDGSQTDPIQVPVPGASQYLVKADVSISERAIV